ncbi:hypothetical protein OB955_04745 [Halobacteria archaeon AArc-m2/3/4]|uniref:Uncharacterized protein n=1 Tax=Natronoglomus mannanivorans TaxID=2979990 RepID=A0ABT2QAT7_9EURY|nr:hypothetical protein [Halobacteria archaeon AArc-m2/3/4]
MLETDLEGAMHNAVEDEPDEKVLAIYVSLKLMYKDGTIIPASAVQEMRSILSDELSERGYESVGAGDVDTGYVVETMHEFGEFIVPVLEEAGVLKGCNL